MDYQKAKARGDRGESKVAETLMRHCGSDDRIVNDVLLDAVDTTTQIDHMLVDRFGILVVETKNYRALLRGTSHDAFWTACYPKKKSKTLPNPILQNNTHRDKLRRVLQQHGLPIDPSYVQSVVVFASGNIDHLDLPLEDQSRVMRVADFESHLQTRSDFPPNQGDLDGGKIDAIAHMLEGLNKSGDSAVQTRHDKLVATAGSRRGRRKMPSRPATTLAAGKRPSPSPTHSTAAKSLDRPSSTGQPRSMTVKLALAGLGLGLAMLVVGGYGTLGMAQRALQFPTQSAEAVGVSAAPTGPAVEDALAALRDADPKLAEALTEPNNPVLSEKNGYATYTWQYLERAGDAGVKVGTLSVSYDSQARIVGFSRQ